MVAFVVLNRFDTTKFSKWLKDRVASGAHIVAGRLPDMPNRVIGVEMQAGPGLVMDGLFDIVAFRISCRGAENNLPDAEAIALDVDNVLLNADENFDFGVVGDSVWCNEIGRTGGAPTQQSISDSQSRWVFTCTYYARVSTDLG